MSGPALVAASVGFLGQDIGVDWRGDGTLPEEVNQIRKGCHDG